MVDKTEPPLKQIAFATAMREVLAEGYKFHHFRKDFLAAIVVSLVALPLSMALAIAVGLPPQQGLYTAIIAGAAVALLGGSRTQVTGPTAAFIVILAPIVTEYGLRGIIWCQLMAGVILLFMGFSRLGRYIRYIPNPVVIGFTTGIAVVIFMLSLNDFLGLNITIPGGSFIAKSAAIIDRLPYLNIAEATIGITSFLVMLYSGKVIKFIPSPLIGIIVGSLMAYYFQMQGFDIATIFNRFRYDDGIFGGYGIPSIPPIFHYPGEHVALFTFPDAHEFSRYLPSAMIIAALAALESLLSATVADSMTPGHQKHNPNAELNGLGIGNILSGMFCGIPATGAIARTSTNIHAGAHSPLASFMHAILLLFYMLALTPLINKIPMASLAALLVITAIRMSHYKQFKGIMKNGGREEAAVLLTCFTLTVLLDMVAGVCGGIFLSLLLYARKRFISKPL